MTPVPLDVTKAFPGSVAVVMDFAVVTSVGAVAAAAEEHRPEEEVRASLLLDFPPSYYDKLKDDW